MSVDSKAVQGRRKLKFNSFDDVIADAEKLVNSSNTKMLGNWQLSQLLAHLASATNSSVDGISVKAPWFIRLVGPFIKSRVLYGRMSPGFKLPKKAETRSFPAGLSPQETLQQLRTAIARLKNERMTAVHPVFGKLTDEEWALFHLRHAELHLSFAVPE